ncbi:MAG TPA: putative toxin-antitoxin system toxin component, PIN family [Anaerolineae bacterium]|nr:putative toxin-antitoxin system toxin component, PIN family [Anaerolineae bacterium]HQH39829.1 putative toxin-antitoxin system toxin component, PIN family [Anaerolineae bacterium]
MSIVAVIDTNVWVSAFLNPEGYPARLIRAGKDGAFLIVSALPLLDELQEVLRRPRIRKIRQITDWDIDRFVEGVAAVVQLVPVPGELNLCRDPDDNLVLETALQGKVHYVVTRDEDMTRDLDLVEHLHQLDVEILTVQRFISLLRLDENS